tara:strand:- start:560 stop:1192 length:633 start_codon:yes stop_codon:yes gene_type:complete
MEEINQDELERRGNIIVEEFEGIFPLHEAFYIHSIIYSAGRANEAFLRYETGLTTKADAGFVVSSVHEALGHSAALSRFFWPSALGGKARRSKLQLRQSRAEKLRKAFGLDETSALRCRGLRDALEHFDERLDAFLLTNDIGQFFPTPFIESQELAEDASVHIFKLVDPKTSCFVLLGEEYAFNAIRQSTSDILRKAERMDRNGSRLFSD